MANQKGAALVVVLSLLTVSLMVGLSSMQSSQIDERLAGNYKAVTEAEMGAENAASQGWESVSGSKTFDSIPLEDVVEMGWEAFKSDPEFSTSLGAGDDECVGNVSCFYRYIQDGGEYYIVSLGAVLSDGQLIALSQPVSVRLDVELSGFGEPSATIFPGGIAEDADVQWPSSKNSLMSGGEIEVDDVSQKVYAVSLYEAEGGLSAQDIMDGITGKNKTGLTMEEGSETLIGHDYPYLGLVDIVKSMYADYVSAGTDAGSLYPDIHFHEDGMDVTGSTSLEGLHVVLNGEARIGGNASLSGMLIVLNVDVESDDWYPALATRAKFNGGGNKGTVWFDESSVNASISPFGVSIEQLLGLDSNAGEAPVNIKGIDEWN